MLSANEVPPTLQQQSQFCETPLLSKSASVEKGEIKRHPQKSGSNCKIKRKSLEQVVRQKVCGPPRLLLSEPVVQLCEAPMPPRSFMRAVDASQNSLASANFPLWSTWSSDKVLHWLHPIWRHSHSEEMLDICIKPYLHGSGSSRAAAAGPAGCAGCCPVVHHLFL